MATTKLSKNSPYVEDYPSAKLNPMIFKSDWRAFAADSGAEDPAVGMTVYTVPPDFMLTITDVYVLALSGCQTPSNLSIYDRSGNLLWKSKDGTIMGTADMSPKNLIEQPLKLTGGDYITFVYRSFAPGGTLSFSIIGIKELDTLKLGLW